MACVSAEDSSITDVVNGCDQFDREAEKTLSTPLLKQLVHKTVRRWKSKHEAVINKRIGKVKLERKKRLQDNMASTFPENRLIPLDILAKEWMEDNPVTVDLRVYLIEKLFPSLIMGLEKLLDEVEKRQLVDSESASPSFNPVNYLAQYLMRNNPIYSNFPEASPYARGLRKAAEDLKSNIFEMEANRLARLKVEAQKRLEREKMARLEQDEQERRNDLFEDLFVKWVVNEETIPLSVIQNALCSFCEYLKSLPVTSPEDEYSSLEIPEINTTGKLLTINEFKKVMDGYTTSLSVEVFEQLMGYLTKCAEDYQQAAERVSIRYNLKMLFLACDHDAVGVLEHNRVLEVLENYYFSSTEKMRETLKNPREMLPSVYMTASQEDNVVEEKREDKNTTESQEDNVVVEEKREDEKRAKTDEVSEESKLGNSDEILEKQQIDENDAENQEKLKKEDLQDDIINKEAITGEIRIDSDGDQLAEQDQDYQTSLSISACGDNSDVLENESKASSKDSEDELSAPPSEQSLFDKTAVDENHLNRNQFVDICERFLGDEPMKSTLDSLVRFIKVNFSETDQQRIERHEKAHLEARARKRKYMVEQLFDFWDVDRSGVLNFEEVVEVLSNWKDITSTTQFLEFVEKSKETVEELTCSELHDYIDSVCNSCFPDESPFEAIVIFLHTTIERTFEERKRGEARKAWLNMIETTAQTSGGNLEAVYKATFEAIRNDGEAHGRNKVINASISFLEININPEKKLNRGANFLRYCAATPDDIPFVLGKCLYRDSKAVSFAVVDSGKPIHIPKVLNHPGVHLWNPERKEKGANGSLIILPLKDHEKRVVGVLAVDTLADQQEKSVFITHEISFYQGVAKALSQAMQFVDIRSKTVKIADSAISWICRRSLSSKNCNFYLVEPGLHPSDGFVLRKMFTIDNQRKRECYENAPRMYRKDNLFRDYLFKCVEGCDTITADAYGERHIAFPLRDARGAAIAVVDISIGDSKMLPAEEMKEVKKMVQLLAEAHREIAGEIAGLGKMIVLEVEKQNENFRIEIMFDRLMLTDLRENVARLDARAFAEIKSYKDPPKLVHEILKTVLGIFHGEAEQKFENWSTCKSFINADLLKMVTQYDPTALSSLNVDEKKLSEILEGIPMGTVAKQASLPAQYLFNWAIVSLSLIEHTRKMNLGEAIPTGSAASTSDDCETIMTEND